MGSKAPPVVFNESNKKAVATSNRQRIVGEFNSSDKKSLIVTDTPDFFGVGSCVYFIIKRAAAKHGSSYAF